VLAFFAIGWWPYDFSPKNRVAWLAGENGLRFMGENVTHGRTVGGYVRSAGPPLKEDSDSRGFSIEVLLRSAEDSKGGVPYFLSFVDDSGKVALLLGQWRSSLVIRRPAQGYDVREKWKEIGAKDALPKGIRRLITIVMDAKGTSIYVDGLRARSYPLQFDDFARGIMDCSIILGNSPSGKASWSGDVLGLAFYGIGLNDSEVLESFHEWTRGEKTGKTRQTALYLFDEGAGSRVHDASDAAAPLMIPAHPAFQKEVLVRPLIRDYSRLLYMKDTVVNILGFIPLGFFLSVSIMKKGRRSMMGRTILIAAAVGALVSMTIEIVQAFIPVRDSSLMDLICNTVGTVLGAGVGFWVSRAGFLEPETDKKLIAHS
jgi:hypothetical protein